MSKFLLLFFITAYFIYKKRLIGALCLNAPLTILPNAEYYFCALLNKKLLTLAKMMLHIWYILTQRMVGFVHLRSTNPSHFHK